VPLARGRCSDFGLILMALSMTIVILEPRLHLSVLGAGAYVVGFAIGLWLLLGLV
jgi:hypothetical protein